jgi:hypothetical protein
MRMAVGPGAASEKAPGPGANEPIAGFGEALKRAAIGRRRYFKMNGPASFLTGPFSLPFRRQGLPDDYG